MFEDRGARAWLDDLNGAQRAAATHAGGPLLILAGAGTGKTTTLCSRMAWLLAEGIPAERILLLTFTRRAAREMVRRAQGGAGRELPRLRRAQACFGRARPRRPAALLARARSRRGHRSRDGRRLRARARGRVPGRQRHPGRHRAKATRSAPRADGGG